jgi:hypothetical protein
MSVIALTRRVFACRDLPAVSSYLSALVPERCIVLVMNSAFAGRTDKKERWYGTDYNIGMYLIDMVCTTVKRISLFMPQSVHFLCLK